MSRIKCFGSRFLKDTLWPIFPGEARRVLLLSFFLFLVCFNYSVLRCMKDTVVVTASSAAVIPYIKVWTLLPMAVLFTFLYTKIANAFSREKVFYLIVSSFLSFFALFAFVLYPMGDKTHLTALASKLGQVLPAGMAGFIAMVEYWSFTLFYIIAELWSNIVLSILTWGLINEITSLKEAPRFYSVLSVASNIAAIAAGLTANIFVSGSFRNNWQLSQQYLICVIILSGLMTMWIYRKLDRDIEKAESSISDKKQAKAKIKFSLSDGCKEIAQSKHLRYLATIVVAYFFVINTVEVIWKEQVRLLYPKPADFNYYMNTITACIGVVSTSLGIFVSVLIKKLGWSKTALLTPAVMLSTSILFFVFIVFNNDLGMITALVGTSPLAIAVFLGSMQNCLSKGAKYSIFDSTKEMAFIPLSRESKIRGKAVIDGVFSRLGKSGASLSLQGLILVHGSLLASTPYITGFMLLVIVAWIYASRSLGQIIDPALKNEAFLDNAVDAQPKPIDEREGQIAVSAIS